MRAKMTIDEIRDNFELLEEWDDRYRYVIELGRTLDPMPDSAAPGTAPETVKLAKLRGGAATTAHR